jgi:hypothetical protein
MSAALPPRNKGQAGGFEQRMAKGPDGEGLFPVCLTAVRALCASVRVCCCCSPDMTGDVDGQAQGDSRGPVEAQAFRPA